MSNMKRVVACLAAFVVLASAQALRAETPLDFDGDGRSDLAIFRNGVWWIQFSGGGQAVNAFGQAGDTLVPADYDGDGKTDRAIWRNGVFWVQGSLGSTFTLTWGKAGDDPRVVADYDGDGKADLAIYRPGASAGQPGFYWIRRSSDLATQVVQWGVNGDIPLPGSFTGFSRADYCVFRPSDNTFYVLDGQTSAVTTFTLGDSTTDRIVAMKRIGQLTNFAVFRNSGPNAGDWYSQSTQGASLYEPKYGLAGDLPLPFVETAFGNSSLTVVRDQGGQLHWYRRQAVDGSFSNVVFGKTGDVIPANTFFTR
jgi:hypothetical protein